MSALHENYTKKSKIKSAVTYFREYCNATSIHGFRYFGEPRTICEKVWWFIIFVLCLILCILSIMTVYKKWDQSPVIVTFATKGEYISNIPFPAVTVCSELKIRRSVFDYTGTLIKKKNGLSLTKREEAFLSHMSYVCNTREDLDYSNLNSSSIDSFDILKTIEKVTPQFKIIKCRYMGKKYSCDKLFIPLLADEGLCYTFNMVDRQEFFNENVIFYSDFHSVGHNSSEWSPEHGYSEESGVNTYPKRALMAGARYGLRFEVKVPNEQIDAACRDSVEGFRILFHAPMRFPCPSQEYIRIPFNRVLSATIAPSKIMTSEAVKNYSPKKRSCYFSSERTLKYFKIYTQKNCDLECLANFTMDSCQCVLFYMPRDNNTRICNNGQDLICIEEAEIALQTLRLRGRIRFKKGEKPPHIQQHTCGCLPICADISYRVGSSQAFWNISAEMESGLNSSNDSDSNITNYHVSRVRAYFVSNHFIGSERNELYGPTDFLANFGGLLGLFTGFSILSLMEIIYFLSVRLICNVRLYGRWAGSEE